MRMLFLDFSSAFNTIMPQRLESKLPPLVFSIPLCNGLLDFLTDRPQSVRVGVSTSSVIFLSNGSPQGWVHCCSPLWPCARSTTNHIVKLAYDTTVVGLICDDNDNEEVKHLVDWCKAGNLTLPDQGSHYQEWHLPSSLWHLPSPAAGLCKAALQPLQQNSQVPQQLLLSCHNTVKHKITIPSPIHIVYCPLYCILYIVFKTTLFQLFIFHVNTCFSFLTILSPWNEISFPLHCKVKFEWQ